MPALRLSSSRHERVVRVMTSIFLSYRRSDTGGYAGRLTDALEKHFGKNSVFQDIEAITPGSNFEKAIDTAVAHCDVLLVLIG
ncbi:MAG: toll/interleukin-1 receptor domain-containing protein, partial [Burkholderiales bacterium]